MCHVDDSVEGHLVDGEVVDVEKFEWHISEN